jgi:hypothetical protein
MCCYLSGGIDFSKDKGAGWRNTITPFLQNMGVTVFNPLCHPFKGAKEIDSRRPYMAKLLQEGKLEELRNEMKPIVRMDLRSIDLSSFLIVGDYSTSTHLCGTIEEISVCNKQVKPCLVVCKDGKKSLPSWLYGRLPSDHLFDSWDDLKTYLTAINTDPNYQFSEADLKRWLFFDYNE